MLDKTTERIFEDLASLYIPTLEEKTHVRANELAAMKVKVITSPEEVMAWFDQEIEKVKKVNLTSILEELKKSL